MKNLPMFYLLECPLGVALFKKDEEQVSLLDKHTFGTDSDPISIFSSLDEGVVPDSIKDLIRQHCPPASTINILSEKLAKSLGDELHVNVVCTPDECFRRIRLNCFKHFGISKDEYKAQTARMAHRMIETDRSDVVLIDILNYVEEMDVCINNRIMRVREWYSIHFPELNSILENNMEYLKMVLRVGNRKTFIQDEKSETEHTDNSRLVDLARQSMGCDMKDADIQSIKDDVLNILKDVEYREGMLVFMKTKAQQGFPNLYNLIGEVILARLLRKAGSISKLSQLPSSTVQILGSEKAFNEAIKSKGNTPKHGIIFNHSFISGLPDNIRGRVARVVANKIALCARVDSDPKRAIKGDFGAKMKVLVEKVIEKLSDHREKEKKPIINKKKRVISVADYDVSRDSRKRAKKPD